jgi:hypothetical protein
VQVSLTPLNTEGNWVPGIWSGSPAKTYERYIECPLDEGPLFAPVGGTSAVQIKAAIVKAFEGHVYGVQRRRRPQPADPRFDGLCAQPHHRDARQWCRAAVCGD